MKYILLLTLTFFGCKEEKKEEKNIKEEPVVQKVEKQKNILNWEEVWTKGIGSVEGFKSFGKEEESRRILDVNQDYKKQVIWECIPDNSTTWDGGFVTSKIDVDSKSAYRYTAWVRKINGKVGRIYYAVDGVEKITGESVKNANFIASGSVPEKLEEWYFLVGYIYPEDYVSSAEKEIISGMYYQGEKVQNGIDFKWKADVNKATFRTLLNNCKESIQERLYISSPSLYKIDGTEPKLSLLM